MGRVLAHGVNPSPPKVEDFDISRMMKEKDVYVFARGGTVKGMGEEILTSGQTAPTGADSNNEHRDDEEHDDE
jgi:hypothetical protein